MRSVKVYYQCREGSTELVEHEKDLKSHGEACETIDNYPWSEELEMFEEHHEGGGFFFISGDIKGEYASYQFTPFEKDLGLLGLKVVSKTGFLYFFGRKSVSVNFEFVSILEAKNHIKELFEYSLDSLYEKYKK